MVFGMFGHTVGLPNLRGDALAGAPGERGSLDRASSCGLESPLEPDAKQHDLRVRDPAQEGNFVGERPTDLGLQATLQETDRTSGKTMNNELTN